MSEAATDQVQTDAEAMASAMAGYNKEARGEQPPAEVSTEPSAAPEATPVIEAEPPVAEPDPAPAQQPSVTDLADELKALKAKVASSAGDTETVRKLHGEIGNINRTLKQLQTSKPEAAPVDDELTAALKAAESAAEEYPELAGPIVKALKALHSTKQTNVDKAPENIDERVSALVSKIRQNEAIEALAEEHPDFETVRETPEFKAWEATKTPEYQNKLRNTWNPAVVAKGLTEFKESLKAKQKKQERLASAVVTQGTQQQAKPSTLPDDEGLWVGYNKGGKRLNKR